MRLDLRISSLEQVEQMEDTYRDCILPILLSNSSQIEKIIVTQNTEKSAEIIVGSLIYVQKLQHLFLDGFDYSKAAMVSLTGVLEKNKDTLKRIVIHHCLTQSRFNNYGDMHRRTITAFVDTLAGLGDQLESIIIQGIPMNEGDIVNALCKLFHSIKSLKVLRLQYTLVDKKSLLIKKLAEAVKSSNLLTKVQFVQWDEQSGNFLQTLKKM